MDKSGANYAGLANINLLLILAGFATMIDICQVKYLNNIIEQDHRFIKKKRQLQRLHHGAQTA
jgi:putative transposase